MSSYTRPTEPTLSVAKERVDGTCPSCGVENLATYPVLAEYGWEQVVKCQTCLCSVSRTALPLLGPVDILVNSL